jgi:hypothetical protein
MLTTTWDSTGSKNAYLDGGPAFHENGAYPTYAASNQFTIGGLDADGTAGPPGQNFNQDIIGDIAEILIYNNVDDAQRASVQAYLTNKYFQAAPNQPGDFNSDGVVDAGDYVTWKKNAGTSNALANDNGLGTPIGAAHYDLWRANFGNPPGAGSGSSLSAAVPEPDYGVLAAIALLGSAWLHRRHAAMI